MSAEAMNARESQAALVHALMTSLSKIEAEMAKAYKDPTAWKALEEAKDVAETMAIQSIHGADATAMFFQLGPEIVPVADPYLEKRAKWDALNDMVQAVAVRPRPRD